MSNNIIEIQNLNFGFDKTKLILKNVNLKVPKGSIYGFLGSNGAGKSTTMRLIMGLFNDDQNSVKVFDTSVSTLYPEGFNKIGSLIDYPAFYDHLSGYDNLKIVCILRDLKESRIDEILELVGLSEAGNIKMKKYSLGMKQRLAIGLALISNPELLVLDEPVNGLDPQGIIEIREVLLRLSKENNITIIISSHILEELSKLVSRIGIINNKKIIEEISKEELLEKTKDKLEIVTNQVEKAVMVLEEELHIQNIKVIDEKTIYVYERLEDSGDINNTLLTSGIKIDSLSISRESLEDYFINMTGVEQHA